MLRCLLAVIEARPLSVHFSLLNSPDAEEPVRVPRTLAPAGAFVALSITDADGRPVYETMPAKLKLKLDPARSESYLTLDPGSSSGSLLVVEGDELWLEPGDYVVHADYSNRNFTGPRDDPIGELSCAATAAFTV